MSELSKMARVLVLACLFLNLIAFLPVTPARAYSNIFLETFETDLDAWVGDEYTAITDDDAFNGTKCVGLIADFPDLRKTDYWSNPVEMGDASDYWVTFAYKANDTHNQNFKVELMNTVWLWFEDDLVRFIVLDDNYVYPASIVEVGSAQIVFDEWNLISVHIIIDSGTDGFYALYVGDTMTNHYYGDNSARLDDGNVDISYFESDGPGDTTASFFLDYFVVYTGRADVFPPVISGSMTLTVTPDEYGGGFLTDINGESPPYEFTVRVDTDFNETVRSIGVLFPYGFYGITEGALTVSDGKAWTLSYSLTPEELLFASLVQEEDEDGLVNGDYIEFGFSSSVSTLSGSDAWNATAYYQADGWYLSLMGYDEETTANRGFCIHSFDTTPQFEGVDMILNFGYYNNRDDVYLMNYTITIPSNFRVLDVLYGDVVREIEYSGGRIVLLDCTANYDGLVFTGYTTAPGPIEFSVEWWVEYLDSSTYGWEPAETVTVEALAEVEDFDESHDFSEGWTGWGWIGGFSSDATNLSFGAWAFDNNVYVDEDGGAILACDEPNNFNYLYRVYSEAFASDFEITVGFEPYSTETPVLTVTDYDGSILFLIMTDDGNLTYVRFDDPDFKYGLTFDDLPFAYNGTVIAPSPEGLNTVKAEYSVADGEVTIFVEGENVGTFPANDADAEGRIVILGDWWGRDTEEIGTGSGEFKATSYVFFMEVDTLGPIRLWCLLIGLLLLLGPVVYMATRPEAIEVYLYSPCVMVLGAALLVYMTTL